MRFAPPGRLDFSSPRFAGSVEDNVHPVTWPNPGRFDQMDAGGDKAIVSDDEAGASSAAGWVKGTYNASRQADGHFCLSCVSLFFDCKCFAAPITTEYHSVACC
jgi:hypothetical protein